MRIFSKLRKIFFPTFAEWLIKQDEKIKKELENQEVVDILLRLYPEYLEEYEEIQIRRSQK